MESDIEVGTGEVKISCAGAALCARALGSCIAVVAYDPVKKMGGIAHVMLPGRAGKNIKDEKTRYAEDGIEDLLSKLTDLGVKAASLEISLVGGADLLGEGDIHSLLTASVLGYLSRLGIEPKIERLGGRLARSVRLETDSGKVFYAEGEQRTMILSSEGEKACHLPQDEEIGGS